MGTWEWWDAKGSTIDSRDVIARIAELEDAADEEPSDLGCTLCGEGSMPDVAYPSLCTEHGEELAILRDLSEQAESAADWQYGATLIPDHAFEDFARELAEDTGAISPDAGWPLNHIDWQAAAYALRMDYTLVDAGGESYLIRS